MSGIIINSYAYAATGLADVDNLYSMDFDGVDEYLSIGNPTELQITGALTLSAWVKGSGGSGNLSLIHI